MGSRGSTPLRLDGEIFVSWAIANEQPAAVSHLFFTDLYLDGAFIERWEFDGLPASQVGFVDDWNGLIGRARLVPGRHTLTLVVDSTDLIAETDESDNAIEWEFRLEASASLTPMPLPTRLPDLVPFSPPGWDGPLVATAYTGTTVDGPLSVSVPTYIRYSVQNQGLSSARERVWVHIFLDGVLVEATFWDGGIVETLLARPEWDGLPRVIRLTPGTHTLKMVIDPTDLVIESDESNNTFEKQLTWSVGPVESMPSSVATPVPILPTPLTLPNLVPGWRFGWDGPIIVSHEKGTFLDSLLTVGEPVFVDLVVINESSIGFETGLSVELYLDNEKVGTAEFPGETGASSVRWREDWDALAQGIVVTEGAHTLRLVIDPDDLVLESNEDDNVYEKTLVWGSGEATAAAPISYTDAELAEKLIDLKALLDTRDVVVGPEGDNYSARVLDIAEAGYFLMTGTSLLDERVQIWLLAHDDYLAWIDESFDEKFAKSDRSDYQSILAEREKIKTAVAGFKTRRFGKTAVVVDAERSVAETLNSLVHELGHMRQDFLAPAQTNAEGPHISGVREAQAQQFERSFWLTLEEFTGVSLLAYPDIEDFRLLVERGFQRWLRDAGSDEHALGYLLQWLAVLDDPALADLRSELLSAGSLDAASSLRLFDYFVALDPDAAQQYVTARLDALDALTPTVISIVQGRLAPDLDPDLEGRPALREPGLLTP
ncbi:MAG: hypothetical protein IH956_04075 [Chloroflexi bacterium]|nr:hypothetical protein [Chloroflexota bacterium]